MYIGNRCDDDDAAAAADDVDDVVDDDDDAFAFCACGNSLGGRPRFAASQLSSIRGNTIYNISRVLTAQHCTILLLPRIVARRWV